MKEIELTKGDKINYIICKKIGKAYKMSAKEGTFVEKIDKNLAHVKAKNGKIQFVKLEDIRLQEEKNALTESILKAKI